MTKLVEGAGLAGACEPDWGEHEEFFSRKISVPREICAEKEFGIDNSLGNIAQVLYSHKSVASSRTILTFSSFKPINFKGRLSAFTSWQSTTPFFKRFCFSEMPSVV